MQSHIIKQTGNYLLHKVTNNDLGMQRTSRCHFWPSESLAISLVYTCTLQIVDKIKLISNNCTSIYEIRNEKTYFDYLK